MKTLADLKRHAQDFTWEQTFNSWFKGEIQPGNKFFKLQRKVIKVQSNSLAFEMPGSKSGLSWLEWPKAKELRIESLPMGEYILHLLPSEKNPEMKYHLRPIPAKDGITA